MPLYLASITTAPLFDRDGQPIYRRDAAGELVLDGEGNPIQEHYTKPEGISIGQVEWKGHDMRPHGFQRWLLATRAGVEVVGPPKIADTLDEVLRTTVRNAIEQRFGVTLPAGTTCRQFLRDFVLPKLRRRVRDNKRRLQLLDFTVED